MPPAPPLPPPVRLTDLAEPAAARAALRAIFFQSTSRTVFDGDGARERFFATWTGWYLERAPRDVWFLPDGTGGYAGYLTGCRDSAADDGPGRTIPNYAVFADLFPAFPAHLHINLAPDFRGRGLGRRLIDAFAADCRAEGRAGVHAVTAAGARNAGFYTRAGFDHAVERGPLLFLGKPL